MTQGRRPTPLATQRRKGKTHVPPEPKIGRGKAPPAQITPDTFRQEYSQALGDAGILTAADQAAFTVMAQAWWLTARAARELEKHPMTRRDANNIERKSPWLQIWRDAAATFRAYAIEFGMTPSARAKVTPVPTTKKSLAERLFESVSNGAQAED